MQLYIHHVKITKSQLCQLFSQNMSSNLILLPSNYEQWIDTLWYVQIMGKLSMTEQQYHMYWPLVDRFLCHWKTKKHLHRQFQTHYYSCCLSQQWISSKAKAYLLENLSGKIWVTSCCILSTCPMRTKIVKSLKVATDGSKMWSVQQVLDYKSPELKNYDHTISTSWKHKQSSFLNTIIHEELAKGYTLKQVKDCLWGAGSVASYEWLESIGGEFMKQYAYSYTDKIHCNLVIYVQERLNQCSRMNVIGYLKIVTRYYH